MKRILVVAAILAAMLVLVPGTAFSASGTCVTGGTAYLNIADALAIVAGVPGYEQAYHDLQDKLVNGRVYIDPDLEEIANVDWNDRITIDESFVVIADYRWDLELPGDYESALTLAHFLVHEWKHEQQSLVWRGTSNLWDIVGGNPMEREAYIEEITFIDTLIRQMFSDLAATNLTLPEPELIQRLRRLEIALGEKISSISSYNNENAPAYGPIPWTNADRDFFDGIRDGIRDLRLLAEAGEPVPLDRFNELRESYNNREDAIEPKRLEALQEVQQEALQAIEKIEQIDSETIDPTIPIWTPIGDTNKAFIEVYNPSLPYPGNISMYAPKGEYLFLFESVGGFKAVGGPVGIEPSGQTFGPEEARITIKYKPEANPNNIDVYYYKNGVWQKITMGKTVDGVNRTISVLVDHFISFAVLEPPVGGIAEFPQIEEPGTAIPDLSDHNYGALARIIVGAIVGTIILISAVWYVRRRRTKAI